MGTILRFIFSPREGAMQEMDEKEFFTSIELSTGLDIERARTILGNGEGTSISSPMGEWHIEIKTVPVQ